MKGRLYHHGAEDYYECLGCGELIEVPYRAVVKAGQRPALVKEDPESRTLWLELQELDHAACGQFRDARKAEEARRYRRPVLVMPPRGDDGPRSAQKQAPAAS